MNTRTISPDITEITWKQSQMQNEPQIERYRIFIQEKDNVAGTYFFETTDASVTHQLRTPGAMHGKDYEVTVQAISKN